MKTSKTIETKIFEMHKKYSIKTVVQSDNIFLAEITQIGQNWQKDVNIEFGNFPLGGLFIRF